jgi:hypothetical protein
MTERTNLDEMAERRDRETKALNACRNVPTDQLAGLDVAKLIAERNRMKAALEKIIKGAPDERPDFDECNWTNSGDSWDHGFKTMHFDCAKVAREALKGATND